MKISAFQAAMYISSRQIGGSKVFDADGQTVGRLVRVIFDPANGQILAFELMQTVEKYLSPRDVISWKKHYLVLGQNYEIHAADDLIRLQTVLKKNCVDLSGRKVRTESGIKLGRVTDYSINCDHFMLASITVQKRFLHLWSYDTRLIHQTSIVEIKPSEIIVHDSLLKLPSRHGSPDKFALQNSPTFDRALSVPEDRTSS